MFSLEINDVPYRAVLQKDETNPDALFIRGVALYRTGSHAQALAFMKRLITYNPDDKKAIGLFKVKFNFFFLFGLLLSFF